MKPETVFASKAVVGTKYLSKTGFPVKVVEVAEKFTAVESLVNGHKIIKIEPSALLRPFNEKNISKEAREAMKLGVAAKKLASEPKPRFEKNLIGKTLKRTYKGKNYECEVHADGIYYKEKVYLSFSELAAEIAGVPTSGPAWWGLRKVSR